MPVTCIENNCPLEPIALCPVLRHIAWLRFWRTFLYPVPLFLPIRLLLLSYLKAKTPQITLKRKKIDSLVCGQTEWTSCKAFSMWDPYVESGNAFLLMFFISSNLFSVDCLLFSLWF